jgi:hypothetical protein
LPPGIDWPRTSGGVPLHFLAQIDCTELPATDGVLPGSGVLFFFARIDEEMLWGDDDPKNDCRVLFAPRLGTADADVPADLPALMGGYSDLQRDFALQGDPPVNLYPRWSLAFRPIDSWPDASAIDYRLPNFVDYQEAVRQARAAEAMQALGLAAEERQRPSWERNRDPKEAIALPPDAAGRSFPQVWVMVDRIARYLLAGPIAALRNRSDAAPGSQVDRAALQWITLAKQHGWDEAVDPVSAAAFVAWLTTLAGTGVHLRSGVVTAVNVGMRSAVQFAADSPRAAALIPPLYYRELEARHLPVTAEKNRSNPAETQWRLSNSYHQLLGNAGSTQQARSVVRDDVLLLQLNSDYGVNFMFCDVGEVEFWINKDDLAARRFDRVFATTCGG